jgi:Skp family chaperone for outer membrane proteins
MKSKLLILGLIFLPLAMYAQTPEKCQDVDALPKVLYDNFQGAKGSLDHADREIAKEHGVLKDIQKKYLGCEQQPDVTAMRKQAEELLHSSDTNRKSLVDAFAKADREVRNFIRDAHGRHVAYRYLEPWYGNWGRIVTMNFAIVDDKVTVTPTYYELPDPAVR